MRTDCVYADVESCGFAGMAVLIQYAYDDGEIHLFEPWTRPARESLELLESMMDHTLVGFNLAFDHFHYCKIYTTFRLLDKNELPANLPVMEVAIAEKAGRDGPCLKPKGVMDLMLHSRQGKHQTLMSRHDVRVKKIPLHLAEYVRDELESTMELDPILHARWGVYEHKTHKGEVSTEFKDVVLKFKPNKGLKSLAKHCLGLEPEFHSFKEVWADRKDKFAELKWAPYALSCGNDEWMIKDKRGKLLGYCWPHHIHTDIKHWSTNEEARRYARDDVTYTRLLDEYFGYPEANDNDSVLAAMVAAVRWHGFEIDTAKTTELLAKSEALLASSPINVNKPTDVRAYIRESMDETECILLDKSTKKANLEKIASRMVIEEYLEDEETEQCIKCFGEGCVRCDNLGWMKPGPTEASRRASEILKIKAAVKEVDQHRKLLIAGRFHVSLNVIGTLSSRMSGGDGLNAQGIKKSAEVRQAFTLSWPGMVLCGGDFDSFEVTLADAVFGDERLRKDLLSGLSIHTVMAQQLYPDKTFEQVLASKAHADGSIIDMYTRGKQAVFAMLYGGDETTINKKLSIKMKIAVAAFDGFQTRYPGIREARELNQKLFGAMEQTGGIGTKILWNDPKDYCETFLGFRRYFVLENTICKILFELGQAPPKDWKLGHKDSVTGEFVEWTCNRRDRTQTLSGASSSAIYGAAFQLQAANVRAANNHLIQSPGAMITKALQVAVWTLQPWGVSDWVVAPFQVHDEVNVVADPSVTDELAKVVRASVESYRDKVPLIALKWDTGLASWGDDSFKDDDDRRIHIQPDMVIDDRDDPEADLPSLELSSTDWEEKGDDDDDV
jgi:hypothetical protein